MPTHPADAAAAANSFRNSEAAIQAMARSLNRANRGVSPQLRPLLALRFFRGAWDPGTLPRVMQARLYAPKVNEK
jgi:hypothetical protein